MNVNFITDVLKHFVAALRLEMGVLNSRFELDDFWSRWSCILRHVKCLNLQKVPLLATSENNNSENIRYLSELYIGQTREFSW